MGIYQSDYVVTAPALPLVFPKLVAVVNYYEIASSTASDLKFRLTFPEGASESLPPVEKVIQRSMFPPIPPDKMVDDDGDPTINSFRVPFVISPFPFLVEGDIKVRCHFDDGSILKLGRLRLIFRTPSPDPVAASQSQPVAPAS